MSGSVVTSSGARVFASEVEAPAPRLSVATAQRRPARKSLRFICSYRWLAVRLGSVKAVPLLLFHLLPRSDANLLRPSEGNARERRATRGERGGDVPARFSAPWGSFCSSPCSRPACRACPSDGARIRGRQREPAARAAGFIGHRTPLTTLVGQGRPRAVL